MPDPEVAKVVTARSVDRRHEYSLLKSTQGRGGAGFFAVTLLAAGLMSPPSKAVLADDDKPSAVGVQAPVQAIQPISSPRLAGPRRNSTIG